MQPTSRIKIARALVRRRSAYSLGEERNAIPILVPLAHDPAPLMSSAFDLGALTLALRFVHFDAESKGQASAMIGAVIDLLDLDPNGAEAAELRAELEERAP